MSDYDYVGLTNRVGGIHCVKPSQYDEADGFGKTRCGTNASVDHRGDKPIRFGDEGYDKPSCKKCLALGEYPKRDRSLGRTLLGR